VFERTKTVHALDRAGTVIGNLIFGEKNLDPPYRALTPINVVPVFEYLLCDLQKVNILANGVCILSMSGVRLSSLVYYDKTPLKIMLCVILLSIGTWERHFGSTPKTLTR
jgi:hypothetical protein